MDNHMDCKPLVIGISSRALFDLERENTIFEEQGLEAYRAYQFEHEKDILSPGTAFHLAESLLKLNEARSLNERVVDVVIMSRNSPDVSQRIFHTIEHYGLDIRSAAFTGGEMLSNYLNAFGIQLYLSRSTDDVRVALESGIAAAVLYAPPEGFLPADEQIRIAFDGDAVLFSDEAERIYKSDGVEAFIQHERERAREILPDGPFAPFLKTLSFLQKEKLTRGRVVTALVTARSNATQERVAHTLRAWGVQIDQMFFMAGKQKRGVLEAFKPHIYFDDQDVHGVPASAIAPTGKVIPSYEDND